MSCHLPWRFSCSWVFLQILLLQQCFLRQTYLVCRCECNTQHWITLMAKWVCQIPKSRWFINLSMTWLNVQIGCGNRIIVLHVLFWFCWVFFFSISVDLGTCIFTNKISWSGKKVTQSQEQKLCMSDFHSNSVGQKGFLSSILAVSDILRFMNHFPSLTSIVYNFLSTTTSPFRICSFLRSTHHWEMLYSFHIHLDI